MQPFNNAQTGPDRFRGYPLVARNGLLVAARANYDFQPGLTVEDNRVKDELKLHLAMPVCRYVGDTTSQTLTAAVYTNVGFPTVDYDYSKSQTYGTIVANPFSFTCTRKGFYHFNVYVLLETETWVAGDVFQLNLYKNGANNRRLSREDYTPAVARYIALDGSSTMSLATEDVVTPRVFTSNTTSMYNSATAYEHVYIEINYCGISPESV